MAEKKSSAKKYSGGKKIPSRSPHTGGRTSSGRSSSRRKGVSKKTGRSKSKGGYGRLLWAVFAALAVIFGAATAVLHKEKGLEAERGAKLPSGNYRFGIDISHHNEGSIMWDSLMVLTDALGRTVRSKDDAKEAKEVAFVFIKATEGVSLKDRKFHKYWEESGKRGIPRGAYHFYRSGKPPKEQADNFVNTVGELFPTDLPPVLDIETVHKGYSKEKLNSDLKVWLRLVERHYGKKPIVYTGEDFANGVLDKSITDNYTIWVAHYGVDLPERENWDFWQFTDKGIVCGVRGYVDISAARPLSPLRKK